jgi:hypothetical protein
VEISLNVCITESLRLVLQTLLVFFQFVPKLFKVDGVCCKTNVKSKQNLLWLANESAAKMRLLKLSKFMSQAALKSVSFALIIAVNSSTFFTLFLNSSNDSTFTFNCSSLKVASPSLYKQNVSDQLKNLLSKSLALKNKTVPLNGHVLETVQFVPDFSNLFSISGGLDLVVVNVDSHFLVISIVVSAELSMTSF